MNPLTQIKNTQKATFSEIASGISDSASWHARFKHSVYIFAGGLAYDLTEGDLLAVFAQYGEIVDVNLVRDKETKKSKGFAFVAYEDQRSTVLAVDNLSGSRVAGRIIRVEHVDNYKKKKAEMEGEEYHSSDEDSDDDEEEEDDPADDQHLGQRTATAEAAAVNLDEPWMKAGSMFDILSAPREELPAKSHKTKKEKKAKKEKKEKKKKREKDTEREAEARDGQPAAATFGPAIPNTGRPSRGAQPEGGFPPAQRSGAQYAAGSGRSRSPADGGRGHRREPALSHSSRRRSRSPPSRHRRSPSPRERRRSPPRGRDSPPRRSPQRYNSPPCRIRSPYHGRR
mmetsp:Transcript_24171/g.67217  ORF Transcript_24171/g.67217 Transcript_24171/m.67217 type:complete len:341 (+) Transcript_24171:150-1172(+)